MTEKRRGTWGELARSVQGHGLLLAVLALLSVSCSKDLAATKLASLKPEPGVEPESSSERENVDERASGASRLFSRENAEPKVLSRTMLWVSHILVRHQDVQPEVVSFSPSLWHAAPAPPTRSKSEARRLADEIASLANAQPEAFGRLAQQRSEDVTTREQGGSLGGVTAWQLYRWRGVLEALAETPINGVSPVVETMYGFHVFRREPVPPQEIITGRRIVIAYDEAPWLARFLGRREVPRRSREEARKLAQELWEAARSSPDGFEALVHRYSDHRDAIRGGDFGSWSSQEPTPFSREIAALRRVSVGAVTPPLDTLFGFQVIQRVPPRPRVRFAMDSIQFRFDPSADAKSEKSRESVAVKARGVLEELQGGADFESLENRYCCQGVTSWFEGRESPFLESALRALEIGETASDVVQSDLRFFILRRQLPPDEDSSLPVRFELP